MPERKRLEGAEKYLVAQDPHARYEERDALINRANETHDLRVMLNDLGCSIPEGTVGGWKTHCPFDAEHLDGGIEKAMRYYAESNSAYCFSTHGIITPVRLRALAENIPQHKAAQQMVGPSMKYGWRERFRELQSEQTVRSSGSPAYAFTALQVRLRAYPTYLGRQYDSDFREALEARLERLETIGGEFDALMAWVEESVATLAVLLEPEYTCQGEADQRGSHDDHPSDGHQGQLS